MPNTYNTVTLFPFCRHRDCDVMADKFLQGLQHPPCATPSDAFDEFIDTGNYSLDQKVWRLKVYKFIHNTVGRYVHTYSKLHTRTINKQTYQGQYRIKYLHKYRSKLHYFT